ncbi:hypothetical protein AAFF_G00038010 [Aldrovandia affinis]|uniref:SERTA domain-containing protein n=1 Tax=Aldrovandia affinis TaxID=143900 RepID=A0AAD7X074_9TELE|nr:hypothetical protein AAFF_G00038010 [Aldrovandia affinis]
MMGKGLKRKLPEDPEWGRAAERGSIVYERQRQSMLDLSLGKFQRCQSLAEPSLRRLVLIANTLRQIQEEIRLEGTTTTARGPHPGAPEPRLGGEAPPTRPSSAANPGPEEAGDDWIALSSEEDFSLSSSAISSILKELDTVIDGPQAPPPLRTPLGSIENLPGELGPRQDGGVPWRAERRADDGCRPSSEVASGVGVFASLDVMRSSYLRDVALDDLFLDIDTSVCEREAGPFASDELLKYLPALSSSPFAHGQSVRDLNELEHIMEILVGS